MPWTNVQCQDPVTVSMVAMAEFMGNNHASETTGTSPFFANYGYAPRMHFLDEQTLPTDDQEARSFVVTMTELHAHLRTEMGYAQERQEENADRHRIPAPSFQIGDKVWLNVKNIRTRRPSRKLYNKRHGPYEVKARVGTHAYRLELPNTMKIHTSSMCHCWTWQPTIHSKDR